MSYAAEIELAVEAITMLDAKGVGDFLYGAAMESSGFLDIPGPEMESQVYEVRAYGVYARAETLEELRAAWIAAATAELRALHTVAQAERIVMEASDWTKPTEAEIDAAKLVRALARTRSDTLAKAEHILAARPSQRSHPAFSPGAA